MDIFWKRVGNGFRKLASFHTSKSYTLAHNSWGSSNVMSNSIALDLEDQGKPLMATTAGPTVDHRISCNSGQVAVKNGLPEIALPSSKDGKYSELPRFILSYAYMFVFGLLNSFVVIIVHDRSPNRQQYLPLPDLTLDNVPYFPWAFHACEAMAGVLFVIFAILISVHKHRFVILRRCFIIYGSVLLMRCPALLLTSLSVPYTTLECDPVMNDTLWLKFKRAWDLYMKFGLSSRGVKTCGDYMFSGHTVFLSLMNYTITEYTAFIPLHMLSWTITLVAMFFIMLGKAHYSIDVVIAFFLSSLYFNYYHTLASHHNPRNPAATSHDTSSSSCSRFRCCFIRQRLRIWVPFYSYLEKETGGSQVPLEFESPVGAMMRFVRGTRHRAIVGKSRLV